MFKMHRLAVGEPYSATRTRWPEMVEYNFMGGQHELRMFFQAPSKPEIRDIRSGDAEFGLLVEDDVIMFLYRFGHTVPWSDCPYSWHLVPPELRSMPLPLESARQRALLQIVLVDAGSGIVQGYRCSTFSPAFSVVLHRTIICQASRSWPGNPAYERQIAQLYQRYPTSTAMLRNAVARTLGAHRTGLLTQTLRPA